jgi:hypothetical protein
MIRNYSYRYPGSKATHGGYLPVHTLYAATIQDAKYLVSRKRLHLALGLQRRSPAELGVLGISRRLRDSLKVKDSTLAKSMITVALKCNTNVLDGRTVTP